jgi:chromosome segregation ATPase
MADRKAGKPDPFQFMLENRKGIIGAIHESPSLPKAWELLVERVPEIKQVTKFNTFKAYARILNVIETLMDQEEQVRQEKEAFETELDKVRQNQKGNFQQLAGIKKEKETLELELGKVRQEKKILEMELGRVRQELANAQKHIPNFLPNNEKKSRDPIVPKQVEGWGVQLKGNYYRLFKKIDGKVKWIHIGREWDFDLARRKIKTFMS